MIFRLTLRTGSIHCRTCLSQTAMVSEFIGRPNQAPLIGEQGVIQLRWFAIHPEPSCCANSPTVKQVKGTSGLVIASVRNRGLRTGPRFTKLTRRPKAM